MHKSYLQHIMHNTLINSKSEYRNPKQALIHKSEIRNSHPDCLRNCLVLRASGF